MDVMKLGNGNRKKWVILGVSILIAIVIGVTLFFLLRHHNTVVTPKPAVNSFNDKASKGYSISQSNPVGVGDGTNLSEKDRHRLENVIIPTIKDNGTIKSYTDNSTYADLVVTVGGETPTDRQYKMLPTGIVFDASKHVPVLPSRIKVGEKTQVLALSDKKTGQQTAEALVLNPDANILFSPIMEVGVMESKDIALVNAATKTRYIISPNTPTTNMLNSWEYEKDRFKIGDRVFFYEAPANDKLPKQDDKGFNLVYVSKAYVYPAPL